MLKSLSQTMLKDVFALHFHFFFDKIYHPDILLLNFKFTVANNIGSLVHCMKWKH